MDYKPTEKLFSPDEGFIETSTGIRFHPDRPEYNIEDIAHALGMLCRFNGHCRVFYSVAEHSVLVADLIRLAGGSVEEQFDGLMHDACEAYVSDMPAPFKQYCPGLVGLENKIDTSIRDHFGLGYTKIPLTKRCDMIALYIEAYQLMPSRGSIFSNPYGLKNEALGLVNDVWELGWDWDDAGRTFLRRYNEIQSLRHLNSA